MFFLPAIFTSPPALTREFPFPLLNLSKLAPPSREFDFLRGKICLFQTDNFTGWVTEVYRAEIKKFIVEKARAVTESSHAPCLVRKEAPITINDAHALMTKCRIKTLTVMQYGQKADFENKVVHWALKNVRVCVCVVDEASALA